MLKTKAIVINRQDSGDKDALITLFSLEKGLLKAKMRSVKEGKSKQKFAKEIFCFAEFLLAEKNGYFTVTSVECIDSFYEITTDYDKFNEGVQILKMLKIIVLENEPNPALFVETLKVLKVLAYSNVQNNLPICKFLLALFFNQGYNFHTERCSNCNLELMGERYLCLNTGEVLCSFCHDDDCVKISYAMNKAFKFVSETEYDRLNTLSLSKGVVHDMLQLLNRNFERRFLN